MYALYSAKLDDIEKAQHALKKFEENPFFLLDGDFYVKELVKYKDEDINVFYDKVFVYNYYWMDYDFEIGGIMNEFEIIFKNSERADDETFISETKEKCFTQVENNAIFLILRNNILSSALIEACDKNISVSQARKYIEKFLEENECFDTIVSGDILSSAGIALPPQFMGNGFSPSTRPIGDNGTRMYIINEE